MDILEQKNIELKEFLENLPFGFVSGRLINKDSSLGKDLYIEEVNQKFSGLFAKNKSHFIGKRFLTMFPEFDYVFNQEHGVPSFPQNPTKIGFQKVFLPSYNLSLEVFLSKFKNGKASLVLRNLENKTTPDNHVEKVPENSGVYRIGKDGRFIFASQELLQLLKYPDFESLVFRNINDERITLNFTSDEINQQLDKKGQMMDLESSWQTNDGDAIYVNEQMVVVNDTQGHFQYMEGRITDISDQKIAEYQLKQLNTIFHELDVKPDQNIDLIVRKSAEVLKGDTSLFNRYQKNGMLLINQSRYNLEKNTEKQEGRGRVCFEKTIQNPKSTTVIEDLNETEFVRTDPIISKHGYKSYIGHPVLLDNEVVGTLCVLYKRPRSFSDIELRIIVTLANALSLEFKRMLLEEELNAAMKAAETAVRAKSQFLSNMSHEIRTPLNGIMGFSEMLIMEEKDRHKRQMLKMIEESGHQLLMIINDIFDFSVIESGKIELNEREFNIIEIIDSAVSFYHQQAVVKGLELTTDYKQVSQAEMVGDNLKVTQIVINLISNAIKFTDTGGVNISVKSFVEDERVALKIIVEDTGIGIMAEDLDVIFQEFKQLEYYLTKRIKGTGIGLFITKKLVEYLGGKIIAESEPQNGSRFTVSLFMKNKSKKKSKTFMEEHANIENVEPQQVRILLAEDNEANQFLIKAITKSENWQITVVDDGEKAVEAFKLNEFDLILMDVQMPVLNGYEATQMIREIEKERDSDNRTPIIALTAYAMKSDKDLCIKAGMDDYISKPFKRQQFLDAIARMLDNK
ncbi:MAG: response regulator [Bacteroidetes bacterium]|nr:response regulator [Bacteroidota bacterium]